MSTKEVTERQRKNTTADSYNSTKLMTQEHHLGGPDQNFYEDIADLAAVPVAPPIHRAQNPNIQPLEGVSQEGGDPARMAKPPNEYEQVKQRGASSPMLHGVKNSLTGRPLLRKDFTKSSWMGSAGGPVVADESIITQEIPAYLQQAPIQPRWSLKPSTVLQLEMAQGAESHRPASMRHATHAGVINCLCSSRMGGDLSVQCIYCKTWVRYPSILVWYATDKEAATSPLLRLHNWHHRTPRATRMLRVSSGPRGSALYRPEKACRATTSAMGYVRRERQALTCSTRNEARLKEQITIGKKKLIQSLLGYDDALVGRVLKLLEAEGYVKRQRGSRLIRVDGEDRKKARIQEYGNPLKYISQYVSPRMS